MVRKKSTDQNYLAILGNDGEALYYASEAMEGLDPNDVIMTMNAKRGCVLLGPKGADTERCVVLAAWYKDPGAWSLVDYRKAISDSEVEASRKILLDKLNPKIRDRVKVVSTQDYDFWESAVRSRERTSGE